MTTRRIEKKDWTGFFDGVSTPGGMQEKYADIEISGLQVGNQIAAKQLPLFGIVYNCKDDILEIALESLDHLIRHPAEIFVEQTGAALQSISVTDGDGMRHLIRISG